MPKSTTKSTKSTKSPVKKPAAKKSKPGTVGWMIAQLKGLPNDMTLVANSEYDASGGPSCPLVKVVKGKLLWDGTFVTPKQAKEMQKDDPEMWEDETSADYNKAPAACCILLQGEGDFGYEM